MKAADRFQLVEITLHEKATEISSHVTIHMLLQVNVYEGMGDGALLLIKQKSQKEIEEACCKIATRRLQ